VDTSCFGCEYSSHLLAQFRASHELQISILGADAHASAAAALFTLVAFAAGAATFTENVSLLSRISSSLMLSRFKVFKSYDSQSLHLIYLYLFSFTTVMQILRYLPVLYYKYDFIVDQTAQWDKQWTLGALTLPFLEALRDIAGFSIIFRELSVYHVVKVRVLK
jgi:hypothetical protein